MRLVRVVRRVRVARRVEAPALVAAARLVRVVLRVPADLLVEDLHVPEARVKVHLETANAAQVSPNTAIVLPDRVPVARAARELARAATVMPRVGPANVVSASHTVNAVNASPTASVRVVHRVRVLVARVLVVRAARELVRVERGLARVATVMLRVGPANVVSANLTVSVVSASHTVNVVSASHTVNAVSANPTVSVRVVHQVRVLLARAARELARAVMVMLRVGPANVVSASHTVSVRVVLQVRVLVVRVLAVRAAREPARAAREQARAAKIVVVRFAKSLSSGR